jgi:hypothetical protein
LVILVSNEVAIVVVIKMERIKETKMDEVLTNLAFQFIERMQRNGVDKIELVDFLFYGCIVLLGLEIVSIAVLKIAGCKLKVLHSISEFTQHLIIENACLLTHKKINS